MFVGEEGGVTHIYLTKEQLYWYRMDEEAVLHVTLAISLRAQPKDLDPMVKHLMGVTDWLPTCLSQITLNHST